MGNPAANIELQLAINEQMDRDYCARQLERINALAAQTGPGTRQRLQKIYFLASMTIWTTPAHQHGPLYRVARTAKQVLGG